MTPRLLTKKQAAEYVNYSVARFDKLVKSGALPPPVFNGRRYDKEAIDRALDRASGLKKDSRTVLEKWLEENGDGRANLQRAL